MRNIESQRPMKIFREKLNPLLNASTPITITIREWDLAQLETILTVDSLKDDEARKRALHKRRRNSNMLLGAVVGGLIDADSGDDSIVDGVLLGAAFGAICTASPEAPKAQVGLLFRDGSHLAVEVNKDEYTQLQTLVSSNKHEAIDESKSAFKDRYLTDSEVDSILRDRATNAFIKGALSALLIAAMPSLFSFLLEIMNPEQMLPDLFFSILPYVSIVGFIIVFIGSYSSTRRIESFLMGDEEQEFYSALKC